MTKPALSFLALVLLLVAPAAADTVYTYTGDYFVGPTYPTGLASLAGVYTTADRITGSFTVGESFVPEPRQWADRFTDGVISYAFTDGHQTLTGANSTGDFYLGLNSAVGVAWNIWIYSPTSGIFSWNIAGRYDVARLDADNWGGNSGCYIGGCDGSHVGTWAVSVPEPASLVLALAGLSAVAGARWRAGRAGRAPRG